MTLFTDPELAAILAGLRMIQDRLAARRIAPDSLIGMVLTNNGEYLFPIAEDLEPLIERLNQAQPDAPAELPEPPPSAIDAIVRVVLLHPTAVFTPEAIISHGYTNLARYADTMLADSNEEALISQEILFISGGPRPLTEEEHDAMYGDPTPKED